MQEKESTNRFQRSEFMHNSFGQQFRITTFGESHGPAIGVVIDGCPPNLEITKEEIDLELFRRRPGNNPYTSPRKETDSVEILSGIFDGKTTGAPIALLIRNQDANSSSYEEIKNLYRPGHANYTYLAKYGIFDHRGGGRSSGRETAARVAAGAIAKKFLKLHGISCSAYIHAIGGIEIQEIPFESIQEKAAKSPIFCPDESVSIQMIEKLKTTKQEGDSLGAVVGAIAKIPVGLGDPVYSKLEALLAFAMLSIPASKGFEIGMGFRASKMKGSEHNDPLEIEDDGSIYFSQNCSGGTLGGISTGQTLFFKVAFKPTSSIQTPQKTIDLSGKTATLTLPSTARHDPCIAIRAVPVVEAMTALVLINCFLENKKFI